MVLPWVLGDTAYIWVRISNFMTFLMTDVLLGVTITYESYKLLGDSYHKKNWRYTVSMVLVLINVTALILSLFCSGIYSIDSLNVYHRGPWYVTISINGLAVLLLGLSLMISYRKNLTKRMFICFLVSILLPIGAAVYQSFNYGISYNVIAFTIAAINLFVNVMQEQGELTMRAKIELNDMKTELLLSQIGPHFIYNTLSTIKHLCRTDPKKAEETIDDFSVYLRGNLESITEDKFIPFKDELKHVKAYLSIEKKRFGERVNAVYEIQEDDFMVPSLTLQPIVENAVKHGICCREEGGTITIHESSDEQMYTIIVKDDGIGFDSKQTNGPCKGHVGIQNVRQRIMALSSGTLTLESEIDKGTVVTIQIPKRRGEQNEDHCS